MKISKERQLFDNRALVALIIPLIIEQFLAVLVGMADSIMVASVGEAAVSGVCVLFPTPRPRGPTRCRRPWGG